ncbi:MAG: SAM-dependent methyltransferase [Trebonia sp.]
MNSDRFPPSAGGDPAFDASVSHHARVYNYWLGGNDNFAADRAYGDALTAVYPATATTARENRAFLGRAVRFLAGEAGLSQFLDIGTGIPAPGSTHEVAQQARPDSRIVYVDNDPVVLAHARALLTGSQPGTTDYLDADLRDPRLILRQAAQTLDLGKPVGLLLLSVLHAIGDADNPHQVVATLMDALPSGSYLALSHGTTDNVGREIDAKVMELTRQMSHHQYRSRSKEEIAEFFGGLELVEPGLVQAREWRPAPQDKTSGDLVLWAGVARKP